MVSDIRTFSQTNGRTDSHSDYSADPRVAQYRYSLELVLEILVLMTILTNKGSCEPAQLFRLGTARIRNILV